METYYNEQWCQVSYLSDVRAVLLEWHGFAKSERFREACNNALKLMIDKKSHKIIADNRDAKVIKMKDQQWLHEEWMSKAYERGYRTSAVIVSKNLFNDVAVKEIVNQMDKGKFSVHFFTDLDQAKDWLGGQ